MTQLYELNRKQEERVNLMGKYAKDLIKSFKVVTGEVKFAYVIVFDPVYQDDGRQPRYSVSILIPKDDEETISKIEEAINLCKISNMDLWGSTPLEEIKGGLRDGDTEKNDEAYDGHWFINATSTIRPGIVDEKLKSIKSPDEFYSGCYGKASITFFPTIAHQKSIRCSINNIMRTKFGPRLGLQSSPTEDFKEIS